LHGNSWLDLLLFYPLHVKFIRINVSYRILTG